MNKNSVSPPRRGGKIRIVTNVVYGGRAGARSPDRSSVSLNYVVLSHFEVAISNYHQRTRHRSIYLAEHIYFAGISLLTARYLERIMLPKGISLAAAPHPWRKPG
jgi:hypothetical protein